MNKLKVVALGASAGGYEALQEFVSNIDTNISNIVYIIIQHLDSNHPTMLGELLSKFTELPIKMIENNMKILPKTIYICPPNNNLTINDKKYFELLTVSKNTYPKPSINLFFTSLAKEFGENAIAIILSGSGSDGAKGIESIKNAGGITMVQDPKEAKFASMPQASIKTGCVDVVFEIKKIIKKLSKILNNKNTIIKNIAISDVDAIVDMLEYNFNIDFSDYKIETLRRRLERRMVINGVDSLSKYIKILKNNPKELKLLYKDLIIIVTDFFRDKNAWKKLEEYLCNLIKNSKDKEIRVWVVGCASGKEAYSIAIILHKILKALNINKKIIIFATDISEDAIKKARSGIYSKSEIKNINKEYLDTYFEEIDDKYKIVKEIREFVVFSIHDVIKNPPFLKLDLISCRNLLIYFNSTLQNRIIKIFHHSLKDDGILFLGKSEAINNLQKIFIPLERTAKIFKKDTSKEKASMESLIYYPKKYSNKLHIKEKTNVKLNKEDIIYQSMADSLKKELFKNFIIINRNNDVSFISGNAQKYIDIHSGSFNSDITSLIKEDMKLDLRYLISKVRKEHSCFDKIVKLFKTNKITYVNILVFPLKNIGYLMDSIAVVFIEIGDNLYTEATLSSNNKDISIYIKELESQLMLTKERFQTTIEELEISNEELQSTTEELQSTNEELQSTNEELRNVNNELNLKTELLINKTNDLENIFSLLDFAVIIVNKDLKIKLFTPKTKELFDISDSNINENISLLKSKINFGDLKEKLSQVINNKEELNFEIIYNEKIYKVRILPYIDKNSAQNECKGAIFKAVDITEFKKQEKLLIQQSKSAALGEMIGNIAHQWRQPLNALNLYIAECTIEYEEGELNSEKIEEFSKKTNYLIQKMSQTIDDFRNFLKPEKIKKEFYLTKVIEDSLKIVEGSFKAHGIDIIINIDNDIKLNGYSNELAQVLVNIFNNSKDAFVERKIRDPKIIIDVEENEDSIILSIKDNGGGVDEKIINKLTDPYFSTKFAAQGTGLGLYMSRQIIEKSFNGQFIIKNYSNGLETDIILNKEG